MATTSLSSSSSIFSFFLVMFVIVITPTMSMSLPISKTNDIFTDVCSTSLDIPYCKQVIKTIPGSSQVKDFKNLAQISITYTLKKSQDNINYALSLVKQASEPTLKKAYMSCNSSYFSCHNYIKQAQDYFKVGDYDGVNVQASNAMDSADVCRKKLPPIDPSQLPQKSKEFNMLCEIIEMVANKIIGTFNGFVQK